MTKSPWELQKDASISVFSYSETRWRNSCRRRRMEPEPGSPPSPPRIPPSLRRFGAVRNGARITQPTVLDCDRHRMQGNSHNTRLAWVPSQFTGEETILLRRLAAGSTIQQIGRQLRLSPAALLRQLGDLRRRVSVADDVELAAWARRWER